MPCTLHRVGVLSEEIRFSNTATVLLLRAVLTVDVKVSSRIQVLQDVRARGMGRRVYGQRLRLESSAETTLATGGGPATNQLSFVLKDGTSVVLMEIRLKSTTG